MRFYQGEHRFYCGVDSHVRTMYLSILDRGAKARLPTTLRRRLASNPNSRCPRLTPTRFIRRAGPRMPVVDTLRLEGPARRIKRLGFG